MPTSRHCTRCGFSFAGRAVSATQTTCRNARACQRRLLAAFAGAPVHQPARSAAAAAAGEVATLHRTVFLSGASNPTWQGHADRPDVGILIQPGTRSMTKQLQVQGGMFHTFGVDNGCYALKGAPFDADAYFDFLAPLPRTAAFVAIPDKLDWIVDPTGRKNRDGTPALIPVGDAPTTLEWFAHYAPQVRAMGFKVALVLQDGVEDLEIPWDELDAVFVGGSDAWKRIGRGKGLTPTVVALIAEAKRRGKWAHVGRINSAVGMRSCQAAGADSADGTYLAIAGEGSTHKVIEWVDQAA